MHLLGYFITPHFRNSGENWAKTILAKSKGRQIKTYIHHHPMALARMIHRLEPFHPINLENFATFSIASSSPPENPNKLQIDSDKVQAETSTCFVGSTASFSAAVVQLPANNLHTYAVLLFLKVHNYVQYCTLGLGVFRTKMPISGRKKISTQPLIGIFRRPPLSSCLHGVVKCHYLRVEL